MCVPYPLEWLERAGLEPLPLSSHIQRREVCSRVGSTREYPSQKLKKMIIRTIPFFSQDVEITE
jgi:hypothetical protein